MDFHYEKAGSLEEALELKSRYGDDGLFIAGGTDLLVDMRNNVRASGTIIDIADLEEIFYIRQEYNQIKIGAGTRIASIQKSTLVQKYGPVLGKACKTYANPLIKNRATLGGNLINASPAADMATPLLVLEADVILKSINRERAVPLIEFFSGAKKTSQNSDELLTEIRFNQAQSKRYEFLKLGQRNGTYISITSLALLLDVADDIIKDIRLALGSVAPVPFRAYKTEVVLSGGTPSPENLKRAGDTLKNEVKPITDIRGSAEYRRKMSAMLLSMAFKNLGYLS
jgi:carbon-monoxide dehydrogenase medium subunit